MKAIANEKQLADQKLKQEIAVADEKGQKLKDQLRLKRQSRRNSR